MFSEFCQFLSTLLQYTDQLHSFYIVLCVVNALSGIFATVFNFLVLLVIKRSSSLHTPSYVLLSALAFSDLAVGCAVQPLYIAFRVADLTGASTVYCGLGIAYDLFGNCFAGLSFLIITSISIDRFLALYLLERYKLAVTKKRVQALTLFLGFIAALYGLSRMLDRKAYNMIGIILGPLLLVTTSLNYLNINRMVRKQRRRNIRLATQQSLQSYGKEQHGIDMIRYERTLKTLLYVFLTFLLCYLPYIFCTLALRTTQYNLAVEITIHVTVTIVFINSSLNPLFYCWRIPEIRKTVRAILHLDKNQFPNSTDSAQQHEQVPAAVTEESRC